MRAVFIVNRGGGRLTLAYSQLVTKLVLIVKAAFSMTSAKGAFHGERPCFHQVQCFSYGSIFIEDGCISMQASCNIFSKYSESGIVSPVKALHDSERPHF